VERHGGKRTLAATEEAYQQTRESLGSDVFVWLRLVFQGSRRTRFEMDKETVWGKFPVTRRTCGHIPLIDLCGYFVVTLISFNRISLKGSVRGFQKMDRKKSQQTAAGNETVGGGGRERRRAFGKSWLIISHFQGQSF
jgi:hypothetical protein